MAYIKCDKILCKYNYCDICAHNSIELMNGKCLEYNQQKNIKDEIEQREIKFRAWDKENKIMFEVFGFDINTVYPYQRNCDHKISTPLNIEDCILMQYIGIKDKNGKEIYEGDIIKHYNQMQFSDTYKISIVIYDNKKSSFRKRDIEDDKTLMIGENCICEVIGNIYENKKLIL